MPRRDDEYDDDDGSRYDRDEPAPLPRKRGMGVVAILAIVCGIVFVICGGLVVGGYFVVGGARDDAKRMKSQNDLTQIGLAIHNYNDTQAELPSNTYSADGKPLLSWRVHILPYLEYENLYRQFKLDEPWDGPNNIRLLNQMPRTFAPPNGRGPSTTMTYYRGFSSPGAVFERKLVLDEPRLPKDVLSIATIADGAWNTILVVEAGDPVEWTKPDDLDAAPGKPFPKMGGHEWKGGGFQVLMCNGLVRMVKPSVSEATLRAAVTHNGGESLGPDWD